MMRIHSGHWRHLSLFSPKDKQIRPTSARSREALFNILAYPKRTIDLIGPWPDLKQAHFLDGFCGSGSVGLEALSRGALRSYFLDKQPQSLALAKQNWQYCQQKQPLKTIMQPVFLAQDVTKIDACPYPPADIAFLDPPYGQSLLATALKNLSQNGWLADHALCIAEGNQQDINCFQAGLDHDLLYSPPKSGIDNSPVKLPFALFEKRKYGKTHFMILQLHTLSGDPDDPI